MTANMARWWSAPARYQAVGQLGLDGSKRKHRRRV